MFILNKWRHLCTELEIEAIQWRHLGSVVRSARYRPLVSSATYIRKRNLDNVGFGSSTWSSPISYLTEANAGFVETIYATNSCQKIKSGFQLESRRNKSCGVPPHNEGDNAGDSVLSKGDFVKHVFALATLVDQGLWIYRHLNNHVHVTLPLWERNSTNIYSHQVAPSVLRARGWSHLVAPPM